MITLDMREVLAHYKYLGLLTRIGRSKKNALMPLKDCFSKKMINGWIGRNLLWVGREVLVKVVARAILTYAMGIFCFPKDLCLDLQALINRYWWGQKEGKKKIHWVARKRLSRSKAEGSLGFWVFEVFNLALLAKQFWRIMHADESLVFQVLKAATFLILI